MAITFTQQPGEVNFSNNPIILKAKTNIANKVFLRIICEVTFSNSNTLEYSYTETYSSPVEDQGTAIFNLANASRVYYNLMVRDLNEPWMVYLAMEKMQIKCYEKWIENGVEQTSASTSTSEVLVLPGGLTDFERMKAQSEDLGNILLEQNRLSRKPQEGAIVYPGEIILMPYYNTASYIKATKSLSSNGEVLNSDTIGLYSRSVGIINFTIEDSYVNKELAATCHTMRMDAYVRPWDPRVRFLRFINSFGMVENISVCCNDALEYEINTEESTLIGEVSYRHTNRRMSRKTTDTGSYALSSGYVDNKWAEWFTHEVLMTPRAWMEIDGVWVPGDILPDDSVQMYDRTEPGLQNVEFTFKMGIEGGVKNSFI